MADGDRLDPFCRPSAAAAAATAAAASSAVAPASAGNPAAPAFLLGDNLRPA